MIQNIYIISQTDNLVYSKTYYLPDYDKQILSDFLLSLIQFAKNFSQGSLEYLKLDKFQVYIQSQSSLILAITLDPGNINKFTSKLIKKIVKQFQIGCQLLKDKKKIVNQVLDEFEIYLTRNVTLE